MDRININGIEYVRADQVLPASTAHTKPSRIPQPRMVGRKCNWCKALFQARAADVKRGWGKFCSKSCKAMRQEKRTGQHQALRHRANDDMHQAALDGMGDFMASDGGAHIFDSSGHGQS